MLFNPKGCSKMRILRFSILLLVGILTIWSFFPIPTETKINYVERVENKRVFALPSMVEVDPVVYEDMTLTELAMKIDRSLSSTVQGQGYLFASYSLERGVDPYLAVAIMLHETGCGWECSSLVKKCNNVGGQKGYPSCGTGGYQRFASLEDGIRKYIDNLKTNYIDKGLTTPSLIEARYTGYRTGTWSSKVENYINQIRSK